MGNEQSGVGTDADSSMNPKTATTYPNAGVRIDLDVECTDCRRMRGEENKMLPRELADNTDRGVVYECPECDKRVVLGRYGASHISVDDSGDNQMNPGANQTGSL